MRKLILVFIIVAANLNSAEAQTAAKSFTVGGNISYRNVKDRYNNGNDEVTTTFSFIPNVGFFVMDGLAIGVNAGISSTSYQDPYGGDKIKSSSLVVGPFARYYKYTSNENLAFFAQLSALVSSSKFGAYVETNEVESSSFDLALSPGFAYFFNSRWSAELTFRGIGYTSADPNKNVDDDKIKTLDFGINSLSPTLGVRVYF